MRRFVEAIDLHIVAMLILFAPAAPFGTWWPALPALIPQGRICTHALADLARSGDRELARRYVVANEALVVVVAATSAALRVACSAETT